MYDRIISLIGYHEGRMMQYGAVLFYCSIIPTTICYKHDRAKMMKLALQ